MDMNRLSIEPCSMNLICPHRRHQDYGIEFALTTDHQSFFDEIADCCKSLEN